jgi:DNA-binding NtrC family response regulator
VTALLTYTWPGNIRELRNVIERAVALCPRPVVQVTDLPEALQSAVSRCSWSAPHSATASLPPVSPLGKVRERAERARIVEALQKTGNNRLRAAVELGISRRTLYKKLHRYGLSERKWPVHHDVVPNAMLHERPKHA